MFTATYAEQPRIEQHYGVGNGQYPDSEANAGGPEIQCAVGEGSAGHPDLSRFPLSPPMAARHFPNAVAGRAQALLHPTGETWTVESGSHTERERFPCRIEIRARI
jgi:hypothetical protein